MSTLSQHAVGISKGTSHTFTPISAWKVHQCYPHRRQRLSTILWCTIFAHTTHSGNHPSVACSTKLRDGRENTRSNGTRHSIPNNPVLGLCYKVTIRSGAGSVTTRIIKSTWLVGYDATMVDESFVPLHCVIPTRCASNWHVCPIQCVWEKLYKVRNVSSMRDMIRNQHTIEERR